MAAALDQKLLTHVCRLWRLRLARLRPDLVIQGSPDRSAARVVIEDARGALYLVEQIPPATAMHRMRIAAILEQLHARGMGAVVPYLSDRRGQHVLPFGTSYWQISPYLDGDALSRPGWVRDAWRGDALAAFLCELRSCSKGLAQATDSVFSPHAYCRDLLATIKNRRPDLARALAPISEPLLGSWLPSDGALPLAFCHGDPHPLNVIWRGKSIRAVIDWEFCGLKPAPYDAALVIGCVGIEDPAALTGGFATAFLAGLRKSELLGDASMQALWAHVVAIRFAWLSDWLRRGDEEMVGLELAYLQLLVARREGLENAWLDA